MKNYQVIWTNNAKYDLENIIEYIKINSISNAKKIFLEIKEKCSNLYYFPLKCRVVPQLQQIGIVKYRELIHKRWRIIYKIDNKKVYILIVVDSNRNVEDLLFQRLLK
jgi:plasmid stabilization system protein ParE